MKYQIIIFFVIYTFLSPAAFADTIHFQNGDRLNGIIKTAGFKLVTPYQDITFPKQLIKSIQLEDNPKKSAVIITVNNDRFSGALPDQMIDMQLTSNDIMHLEMENVRSIMFSSREKSTLITTSCFIMNNQDRFTGRLLMDHITVVSDHLALPVSVEHINRVVVTQPGTNNIQILLNDGGLITGKLEELSLKIESETLSDLTVFVSEISTIQRNADKFILTQYDGPTLCERQNGCSE